MATNNLEILGYNYLTNLSQINADEVNTVLLTKETPSGLITDTQFNQLYGLDTDQTVQQQINEIIQEIADIGTDYWGSFWSTQTQTNAGATSMNLMTLNNADPSNNMVDLSGSSIIKVLSANVYNIQFSAQLEKTDAGSDVIDIWLRKNGSNVADSNTTVTLTANNEKEVAAWNWVITMEANDYIEIAWCSTDTNMQLSYQAAQTSPTRPAIPSVILTVTNVTGIGPQGIQGPKGDKGDKGNRGPKGDTGPRGPRGEDGSGTVDAVARAEATFAIAEATAAAATAAVALSDVAALAGTVATLSGTVGTQGTAITALQTSQATQDAQISALEGKTTNILTADPLVSTTFGGNILLSNYPSGIGTTLSGRGESEFTHLIRAPRVICEGATSTFDSIVVANDAQASGNVSVSGRLYISEIASAPLVKIQTSGAAAADYNFTGISTQTDGFVQSQGYHVGWDDGFGHYPAHRFYHATSDSTKKEIVTFATQNATYHMDNFNYYSSTAVSSNRDCGIEIATAPFPISPDLGTMSIKGGTINIAPGTIATVVNIGSTYGLIYLNGTVVMNGTNLGMTNSFFRQFT